MQQQHHDVLCSVHITIMCDQISSGSTLFDPTDRNIRSSSHTSLLRMPAIRLWHRWHSCEVRCSSTKMTQYLRANIARIALFGVGALDFDTLLKEASPKAITVGMAMTAGAIHLSLYMMWPWLSEVVVRPPLEISGVHDVLVKLILKKDVRHGKS